MTYSTLRALDRVVAASILFVSGVVAVATASLGLV